MPDSETTKQAIRQVLAGDRDAFRVLVREYRLMVRSYVGSQLHRSDETEDLSQEVFMNAYRSLDQFDANADFGAWLRGIARNKMLMHFRTTQRRRQRENEFREEVTRLLEHDLEKIFASQSDFAIAALLRCIGKLPDRMRYVVRAGLDGTKAASLAAELSTSLGAIYNLNYRANSMLRQCVEEEIG
ncbi:ECF RNA polymerase sigma factor SigW [Rubripirellula tenax]|uniref:ECF RNA polymerase sigma factor SigW n=1 Tax=Rubripirellula tenax TaxID=2528015 RepID=A0A5C6FEQ6_9BACT|nr:sigma-70 family RNA polymerase sigma factor [Rubripirellula tenax]TWU59242.1 ECF RNA polymerase sigma factor SigW [Rubripirellula tenax]